MLPKSLNLFRLIIALFLLAIGLQTIFLLAFPKSQTALSSADLMIVFPGDNNRIEMGFKLAFDGYAPNLAISGVGIPHITALAKKYAPRNGVRFLSGSTSRSTLEDALAMKEIVQHNQFKSVILVTSAYHIPRAYLISRLVLIGTGVRLQYYAVHDKQPLPRNSAATMIRGKLLTNEVVKLWGSGVELAWYLTTGTLPRDNAMLHKISLFMRKNIFYCPKLQ